MLRLFGLGFVLLATLAVACGDDDDAGDGAVATPAAAEGAAGDYEASVAAITGRAATRAGELAEPVLEAFAVGAEVTQLARIEEVVPQIIAAQQEAITELEALDAPEQYAADHTRYIAGKRQRLALLQQIVEAAAAGDVARVRALEEERTANERETLNAVSDEFVALAFAGEELALFATLSGGLSAAEQAYVEALRGGALEFRRRAEAFRSAFARSYPNAGGLPRALADAGAGTAMEAAYDVVAAIEPPPTMADDHALVVSYYEEAVRLDRLIGEATRTGDAAAFLVNNAYLQQAPAPFVFGVSPGVCVAVFSPGLCEAGVDLPTGEYERELRLAFRDLAARFTRIGPWGTFELLPAGSGEAVVEAARELGPPAVADVLATPTGSRRSSRRPSSRPTTRFCSRTSTRCWPSRRASSRRPVGRTRRACVPGSRLRGRRRAGPRRRCRSSHAAPSGSTLGPNRVASRCLGFARPRSVLGRQPGVCGSGRIRANGGARWD